MKTKLVVLFIFLIAFQNTYSQDLAGYFEKYYAKGNFPKLQKVMSLGLDPNVTKIQGLSIANYVVSNSKNQTKVINTLEILLRFGLNLNEPVLFQKMAQKKSRKIIDFLYAKGVKIPSIRVNNQNRFSINYLQYLKERGFKIDENILSKRIFKIKKRRFIRDLKAGNIDAISVGLNTFMNNSKMGHIELFYAIKTKNITIIDKVLAKCPDNILTNTYSSKWNIAYGDKPKDFKTSHYPIIWGMATNNLNVVKYLINKGATPLKNGNPKSLPSIKNYVNSQYKFRWHQEFNTSYNYLKSKYERQPNFSSCHILKNSLLKKTINRKIVNKVKRSFGLFPDYSEDLFIELKFLMNNRKIKEIYVETDDPYNTKFLKEYLVKNKRFFEKLFQRIHHKEINYKYLYLEK